MSMLPELAFCDDGSRTLVTHFPYEEIDRNLSGERETHNEARAAALTFVESILRFIWQDAHNNPEGLQIRSMIACWQVLEELGTMSETDLAIGFGMKKQSVGRWVVEWKKQFPEIRSPHLKR